MESLTVYCDTRWFDWLLILNRWAKEVDATGPLVDEAGCIIIYPERRQAKRTGITTRDRSLVVGDTLVLFSGLYCQFIHCTPAYN